AAARPPVKPLSLPKDNTSASFKALKFRLHQNEKRASIGSEPLGKVVLTWALRISTELKTWLYGRVKTLSPLKLKVYDECPSWDSYLPSSVRILPMVLLSSLVASPNSISKVNCIWLAKFLTLEFSNNTRKLSNL